MDYINNTSKPRKVPDMYGPEYERRMQLEAERQWLEEINKTDLIKDKIKSIGFILIPGKNDLFYSKYKNLIPSIKKKYFKKEGLPIDVWCTEAGEDPNDLMEKWRVL